MRRASDERSPFAVARLSLGAGELRRALLESRQVGLRAGQRRFGRIQLEERRRLRAAQRSRPVAASAGRRLRAAARWCRTGDQRTGGHGRAGAAATFESAVPRGGDRSKSADRQRAVKQRFAGISISLVGCSPPAAAATIHAFGRVPPAVGVPFDDRTSFMNSSRTRQAPAILLASVALLAVLLTAVASATANPSIQSKRAQAQAILAQINESDAQLEQAIEAYNYANVQLGQIDADLNSNAQHLAVAQQEPRCRTGAHRRPAAGALRQRRRRRSGRDHPRRAEPRRSPRPPRHGAARRRPGREGARRRQAVPQGSQTAPGEAEERPRRAGADRRAAREPEAVDRRPARRARSACSPASRPRSSSSRPRRPQRQARLAAEARARLAAAQKRRRGCPGGAGDSATSFSSAVDTGARRRRSSRTVVSRPAAVTVRGRRRDRDAGARQAVRLGRRGPGRLRLLRARRVRLRAGRSLAAAQRRRRSTDTARPSRTTISSRATSSSSRASATSASTSAAVSSSTRRTRVTSSRSRA